ncbi:putative F-box/FBD/LRR-repeat protein At4g03220 [Miscanthus floridulus]|uniref:putative F-box/FBD/LRR-repeat protein At4g03220 n=1 Tax=Miscanthus floridulus TaxID=154761 RepID=UPI0034597ECF
MEATQSGGPLAVKTSEDDAGVDRLSTLPDDTLIRILIRLYDAAAACRTSVLSSRWLRFWLLLPELRYLSVGTLDADAESVAAWLPSMARRLTGHLSFTNHAPGRDIDDDDGGGGGEERVTLELRCLSATSVTLGLGCGLGIAVAPIGVFTRLTDISLTRVLFRGPCTLSDAVSSPRCPCLVKLTVRGARGLDNLTIRSDSLREMTLDKVRGLGQLAVASPALEYLSVFGCASFLIGFSRSPTSQRLR